MHCIMTDPLLHKANTSSSLREVILRKINLKSKHSYDSFRVLHLSTPLVPEAKLAEFANSIILMRWLIMSHLI